MNDCVTHRGQKSSDNQLGELRGLWEKELASIFWSHPVGTEAQMVETLGSET